MRSDGSSKFAAGHKWGSFPAVSGGWRMSEEKFLKKVDWLSNLKLRASYGITGNNNIPQYSDMNVINSSNYDLGTGNGTLVPGMASNGASLGNPQITWEQTEEADYGIDFGAFNSRLNLTVDYYNSNTKQLLLQQAAMYITGHQSYWNNIGKVNNKGLEIEISTTNIVTKNFTWKTSLNFSTNKNTLLSLGGPTSLYTYGERNEVYAAIVGQPAIQFYGYKTDGVYTTFAQVAAAKALNVNGTPFLYTKYAPVVGGIRVLNTNGDNALDANDRVVLGSPFPQFTWGITNTFTYKQFDLSFLIQGVQGNKVLDGNAYYNEELRYNEAYLKNRYVSPMFPGDGKTVYSNTTAGADLMLTDYGLENGSFAALRNLTLAYTLSNNLVRKLGISNLRIYLSGQNLAYLMAPGYRGINPESRMTSSYYSSPLISGYQRGDFPVSKIYSIGFDLSL
jgi:TonB-linked SusC/RagA family outer membrane protein